METKKAKYPFKQILIAACIGLILHHIAVLNGYMTDAHLSRLIFGLVVGALYLSFAAQKDENLKNWILNK